MTLPLGKLPAELLASLLPRAPLSDARVVLGPGAGLDCAVVDLGERLLVFKSDPITFASDAAGWYAVQVNANDIATTGATPRWLLATLLLPGGATTPRSVEALFDDVCRACREMDISLIGGHSEVTHGLDRPIVCATLVGEVAPGKLVTPRGARAGNRLLLTKGVPVEGVSLLAREFTARMAGAFSAGEIELARGYLTDPGISVVRDARVALAAGRVTAMHDPTEGGLVSALCELADASGCAIHFDARAVPISDLAARLCAHFAIDPLATIASGALLLAVESADAAAISRALREEGIHCAEIGALVDGSPAVWSAGNMLERPARDEIARLFEPE